MALRMAALEMKVEKAGCEKVSRSFAGEGSRAASVVPDCSRQGCRIGKRRLGLKLLFARAA
jgi:hypothetical protein